MTCLSFVYNLLYELDVHDKIHNKVALLSISLSDLLFPLVFRPVELSKGLTFKVGINFILYLLRVFAYLLINRVNYIIISRRKDLMLVMTIRDGFVDDFVSVV